MAAILPLEEMRAAAAPRRFRFLRKHPTLIAGIALLVIVTVISIAAPWLATHDPQELDPLARIQGPSAEHYFGTDALGRDVFSRAVWGGRISLIVGITVAVLATVIGTLLGLVSGFVRWSDGIIMRVMDGLMAIPGILLAIALMAVTRASLTTVIVAITVPEIPRVVRLVRSLALTLREQLYVEAAHAVGTRLPAILLRHVLPNMVAPLIVQATFVAASAVLLEAVLSFLGVGVPATTPSWGNMMAEGRNVVAVAFHTILYPGILLALTVLAINLVGDGLRDALDPAPGEAVVVSTELDSARTEVSQSAPPKPSIPQGEQALLEVENLRTYFDTLNGAVPAVDGISFVVNAGETLGIVGESGCGKSVTALSIMRLVPAPPARHGGSVRYRGTDLLKVREREMRAIRGNRISMIFQEPMTSLNPVMTVGRQIAETVQLHQRTSRREAHQRAVEMLRTVQIPEPERRADEYPHQLSGGMRQRVMIALALACNPEILIADEPTTALDVTIQAQIVDLLARLQAKFGMGVILITHDLGVVAESCDRVVVMYAGKKVEEASAIDLFDRPLHPYTRALMASMPAMNTATARLSEIPGMVPAPHELGIGCPFAPRCTYVHERCRAAMPRLTGWGAGHVVACWAVEEGRIEAAVAA